MNISQKKYDLSLIDIMMKSDTWQISQIDGQLFCMDKYKNKYDITQFQTDLWCLIYSVHKKLGKLAKNDEQQFMLTYFNQYIRYLKIDFQSIDQNNMLDFMLKLETGEQIYGFELRNPFKKYYPKYIKQAIIQNLNLYNNLLDFQDNEQNLDFKKFNFYHEIFQGFDSFEIKTILACVAFHDYIGFNPIDSASIEFDCDLIKPKFENIIITINSQYVQKIQIKLNITKSLNEITISFSNINLYQEIIINFIDQDIIINKLIIFNTYNFPIKVLDTILQNNNQISQFKLIDPDLKELYSLVRENNKILFIVQTKYKNKEITYFTKLRDELNQQKHQIFGFHLLISNKLIYSPHQTLIDLYFGHN